MIEFKGSHFEGEVILWGMRWYVAYPISYRQLEETMPERGVEVDHSTLNRWVLKYIPLLDQQFRARKRPVGSSWEWTRPMSGETVQNVGVVMPLSETGGGPNAPRRHNRPVRLSGTVYCHKAGFGACGAFRQRWMVAGWTLKVLATSLMDLPSWTRERARIF